MNKNGKYNASKRDSGKAFNQRVQKTHRNNEQNQYRGGKRM